MSCSCRIAPLRIFIQGLSQVHRLDSSFARLPSHPATSAVLRNQTPVLRHARTLHATQLLRSENEATSTPSTSSTPSTPSNSPESREKPPAESNDNAALNDFFAAAAETAKDMARVSQEKPARRKPKSPWMEKDRSDSSSASKPRDRFSQKTRSNLRDTPKSDDRKHSPTRSDELNTEAPKVPQWKIQKAALKEKFPEGWNPRKRLSPDALAGIRALNAQFPEVYTTEALAKKFEVSPENIRRILRSKWQPSVEEEQSRQERWFRRGKSVWERQAALGMKPPRKWRDEGIARDPTYHSWKRNVTKGNQEFEQKEKDIHRQAWQRRGGSGDS